MYRKLRSLLAYYDKSAKDLANYLKITPNTMSNKIKGETEWLFKKEVVPTVEYFNEIHGDKIFTVEDIFEDAFK